MTSLEDQRVNYSKDPGVELAQNILAALKPLDFPREATDTLLDSLIVNIYSPRLPTLIRNYELPDHLEELFTLWGDRYQVRIISGIQQTGKEKAIGFVACEQPLMGWEWHQAVNGDYGDTELPVWASEIDSYVQYHFNNEAPYSGFPLRFYFPVLAEYVDITFDDMAAYKRRRQAIISTIGTLFSQFGLKIRYTESGDIPKEIQDEWLCPEIIEDYNEYMTFVESEIEKNPHKPRYWYEKAGLLLSRDRAEESLVHLKKALELEPRSPQVWYLLSDIYTKMEREEDAKEAERRATDIQDVGGMPESKGDVYYLLDPIQHRHWEIKDGPRFPERERLICDSCDYEFLYVREGIWYACNGCGREQSIKNASLEVELSTETQDPGSDWTDIMKLDATFANKTRYPIDISTKEMELYFEAVVGDDENPAGDTKHVAFTKFPEPVSKVSLKPFEKIFMEAHLKDFEWEAEDPDILVNPGKYVLLLFVVSTVHTDWGDMESVSESNMIDINIPDGER